MFVNGKLYVASVSQSWPELCNGCLALAALRILAGELKSCWASASDDDDLVESSLPLACSLYL